MPLMRVLLPPACAGCGRYGSDVCGDCRAALASSGLVGEPFLAVDPAVVVGDALSLAMAAFAHRDTAQAILRRLKYGGHRQVVEPVARLAVPGLYRLLSLTGPAALVPVPLHASRYRDRGYNQAALVARSLGQMVRLPVWEALARRRATKRQHGLDRATRLRNLGQAMVPSGRPPPGGGWAARPVIVVDDILTTGATLEACATALRTAGLPAVYGFALAREV